MNFIGLVAAASAFLAIWVGHVAVRRIEFASPSIRLPAAAFAASGLVLAGLSLVAGSVVISTGLGIAAVTLLWDALDWRRQEVRVHSGHAPANPVNPRHAQMLAEPGSRATTLDPLKGESLHRSHATVESRGIIY